MPSDPRLLLPASERLLRGWCGPVLLEDGDSAVLVGPDVAPPSPRIGPWLVAPGAPDGWRDYPSPFDLLSATTESLRLDLARDEVADHVARVVAGIVGLLPGAAWLTLREGRHEERWPVYGKRDDGSILYASRPEAIPTHAVLSTQPRFGCTSIVFGSWQIPYKGANFFDHVVPSLAALDPDGDTRLPGGARVVDRVALALVAAEVLRG